MCPVRGSNPRATEQDNKTAGSNPRTRHYLSSLEGYTAPGARLEPKTAVTLV